MISVSLTGISPPLSPLRNDLKLLQGPALENGSPTWTLHDPVRNLFFRIGRLEFSILTYWEKRSAETIMEIVNTTTTLRITIQDILALHDFLGNNQLIIPDSKEALASLKARIKRPASGFLSILLKNYLFFRLPLCRPDRFLAATLPLARFFAGKTFLTLLLLTGLSGLFMAVRQWETFLHTFPYFFSLEGLVCYGLAIFLSKLFHELAHAYTSKHYGLHVPTMGVAFLVMWPVLYSDNSEVWRLKSKGARIRIVAAGTLVELGLALVATFLWSFLPDGPLRSACFVTATVTWISSLLINLSPFLRFDGYYLLSDLWEIPNLHTRAFNLARHFLRKSLLGLAGPVPETFSPAKRRLVTTFGFATWIYRLILFIGIALLVYHFFFKALGVFLFFIELIWFIWLPVQRELKYWWRHRREIGLNPGIILSFCGLIILMLILFVPLDSRVRIPGVLKPGVPHKIYPQFPARLTTIDIQNSDSVKQGVRLFEFESPHLDSRIQILQIRSSMLTERLKRISPHRDLIEQRNILQKQLTSTLTELEGYQLRKQQLTLTSPADGVIMDLADSLVPGRWVNTDLVLGVLVRIDKKALIGYSREQQLARLGPDDRAIFYPDSGDLSPVACRIKEISPVGSRFLDEPSLASIYGGPVPVRSDQGKLTGIQSLYRIQFAIQANGPSLPPHILKGTIVIRGRAETLAGRMARTILAVLVRESGF